MTTNARIAHDFFYSGFDKTRSLSGMSVSYDKNSFYSYYTTIGYVTADKEGNPVTLISRNNMSVTTAKHLSELWSASPYPCIPVEMSFGERLSENAATALQEIAYDFKKALEVYSRQKMSLAKNRNAFIDCYRDAKRFSEKVYTLDFLKDFEKTYIDVTENVEQIKVEQRRADRIEYTLAAEKLKTLLTKQSITELEAWHYNGKLRELIVKEREKHFRKEAKAEIEKLSNMSYSELLNYSVTNPYVRDSYFRIARDAGTKEALKEFETLKSLDITTLEKYKTNNCYLERFIKQHIDSYRREELLAEIKNSVDSLGYAKTLEKVINDSRKVSLFKSLYCTDYSTAYACFVDQAFKTTKGITISEKEGRIALKAWKAGKLNVGDRIRIYRVLSIAPEFVEIGCHKIPTKNLEELCEILGI